MTEGNKMDPGLSSKAPNVNNGEENQAVVEEPAHPWSERAEEGERQRETDTREADVADGSPATAESILPQREPHDKQKFSTMTYQRKTRQKVVTDVATLSKGTSAGAKPRTALKQALFSQGPSDKNTGPGERVQLEMVKQVLESYCVPASLSWTWEEDSQGTTLESNWTDIVASHSTMSKIQRHQQEALWELIHTELTYINKLTVVKDLVIAALGNLHQHGFLQEVKSELLFSNLPSILGAHRLFWQEVIYPMLQEGRRSKLPFDPLGLEAGCLQFSERFSSYLPYCGEEENTLEFTRSQMDTNPHFLAYLQWVETHPQCQRMRVGDMQAKPHQRITKYPLLLKAVLKSTQDPQTQHTLRGMLSSVNNFLETINNYLRFKDEKLALSISAQRVEGYEAEGINEEIDKHVREICRFDLTCPIRGVSHGVVRKLLLEENLKIRGRKDNKLEVVALLFSDVLLMTKVQKKAERLKVVRPPLALDRTCCVVLKDGCSFLLVEVSELGCAMNVYIFITATAARCSTWVSTIQQAKETLNILRETETMRLLNIQRLQHFDARNAVEPNVETTRKPLEHSADVGFVDKLVEGHVIPQSVNGLLKSNLIDTTFQPPDEWVSVGTEAPLWKSKIRDTSSETKSLYRDFSGPPAIETVTWIEMEERENDWKQTDEKELVVEFQGIRERRATWNHNKHLTSVSDQGSDFMSRNPGDPVGRNSYEPHVLLIGGYPDVDYPAPQTGTVVSPHNDHQLTESMTGSGLQKLPSAGRRSMRRDSESQSFAQNTRQDSCYSQSSEEAFLDAWRFSRTFDSPRLWRRKPNNSHHGSPTYPTRGHVPCDETVTWSAPNTNSSSNSDSDCNQQLKGKFKPSGQSPSSHKVLRVGSLKHSHGMFWNMPKNRAFLDLETLSEPKPPKEIAQKDFNKRPEMKPQRSTAIPDIVLQGTPDLTLNSSRILDDSPSPSQGHDPQVRTSPLEGLLERSKVRVRDRDAVKGVRNGNVHTIGTWHPPASPSSSPSPSDGDRDTEWEEVALMRHRAPTVSKGWREQLVDGEEDKKNSSYVFVDGVNVDWPGWCFDDEEVMDHLNPPEHGNSQRGLLEDMSRTLTILDFPGQGDGKISQV